MELIEELRPESIWTQSPGEEIANSISHGIGLLAALVAAPLLLVPAWAIDDAIFRSGIVVYLATIILLYLGSTLYHAWPHTPFKGALQVIDHGAIFLLIAGTYTPFVLGPLRDRGGWTILVIVWTLAVIGIALKVTHGVRRYTKVAMCLYLGMGWAIVFAAGPFLRHVPSSALLWLTAGGVIYTGGVFFFLNERKRYCHFIWHLFVLGGTACHFAAVRACLP